MKLWRERGRKYSIRELQVANNVMSLDDELAKIDADIAANNQTLAEIDRGTSSNAPTTSPISTNTEDDELASIDAKIAANNSKLSQIDSQFSDNSFSPYHEVRGVAKTLGATVDAGRETFPTTDSVVKGTLEMAINSIEGIPGREKELQKLKQDLADISQNPNYSRQEQFVKNVDEFAGEDLGKTGTIGQFRQKLGEFLPGPVSGMKAAPAIAAIAQGLREMGIDEGYADLISAIGVPNIKALAKLPAKALRKIGDFLGTIGSDAYRESGNVEKAAKFFQNKVGEENIAGVVNKIDNYETPFKGSPSQGEAAYEPLTADIADNVGLSQYHRSKAENIPAIGKKRQANEDVMQREIDRLASKNAASQAVQEFAESERKNYQGHIELDNIDTRQKVDRAVSKFDNTASIDEAGRETQGYLENRTSGIRKEAQVESKPLYDAAKEKTLKGKPQGAFDYIDEQMSKYSRQDSAHRDAKNAKIAIENAVGNSGAEQKKLVADIKKKYKDDPNMMETLLKGTEDAPRGTYTAEKLDNAKKELKRIYEKIPPHERERRRDFNEIMKKLDKDMESIPEIFAARQKYREIMQPFNELAENPILGNMFERGEGFTKQFTVTAAEIPKRVISGSRSIEGANALMSEAAGLGKSEHKNMVDTLKSYINSEILSTFVDANGKVNTSKFSSWTKSNPGAFILYPELKTKLKNLENSQLHVDRVIKQNEDLLSKFYEKSMTAILGDKFKGVNPERIAGRILDSSNSEAVAEDVAKLLSRDKTGNASEGIKRAMIDHLKSKFKSDKFTFATLNDYLNKNKKALGKFFNQDQIEVLEKSKELLKKQAVMERAGKGTNSDSIPKLMENIAEMTGGKASEALFGLKIPGWAGKILELPGKLSDLGKIKYLEEALLDPKMAKILLTKDVKTKKNFFDSINNKEDFSKWLRDSESLMDTIKGAAGEAGKNFSITSQAVLKAKLNDS